MIDYLTHPDFVNYNPSELPSRQGGGAGRMLLASREDERVDAIGVKERLLRLQKFTPIDT